jgi:hypothetical protein
VCDHTRRLLTLRLGPNLQPSQLDSQSENDFSLIVIKLGSESFVACLACLELLLEARASAVPKTAEALFF